MSVTRRQFLAAAAGAIALAGCAREKVRPATLVDFLGDDRQPGDPLWSPEARAYVAEFPARYLPAAKTQYTDEQYASVALGLVALSIACPHDGIDVGYCPSYRGYLCPSCGSLYNPVGELASDGPATRGLDRLPVAKDASGGLVIDRGRRIKGPAQAVRALPHEVPEGTSCVGAALRIPAATTPTA